VSIGLGDIPTTDVTKWKFQRLGDTDLWFKTDRVPRDTRFGYLLRVNGGSLQFDPLNPRQFARRSIAELPDAPSQPWIVEREEVPKGDLSRHKIPSHILNEERSVGVYTPPGYDPKGEPINRAFQPEGMMSGAKALPPTRSHRSSPRLTFSAMFTARPRAALNDLLVRVRIHGLTNSRSRELE
jgi:enterochelin esterase family protein